MVDSGIWLLKRMVSGLALRQLTYSDAPHLEGCYLSELAERAHLGLFHNVVLIASKQDRYAPYGSALVLVPPEAGTAGPGSRLDVAARMSEKLLGALEEKVLAGRGRLVRVDVDFYHRGKVPSIDSLVGRTAHIEFLETSAYFQMLAWTHQGLFA